MVSSITGRPCESVTRPVITPPRTGDVRHSLADVTRARELLGYVPRFSFEDGLRQTWHWYLDHHRTQQP